MKKITKNNMLWVIDESFWPDLSTIYWLATHHNIVSCQYSINFFQTCIWITVHYLSVSSSYKAFKLRFQYPKCMHFHRAVWNKNTFSIRSLFNSFPYIFEYFLFKKWTDKNKTQHSVESCIWNLIWNMFLFHFFY